MSELSQLGDRYDLGEVIGRGGMAEVYEGSDRRLNRRVAIKMLRPDLARDPMFQERFRREAQSAAGLNHPNIVAIYDTGEDIFGEPGHETHVPYIVMEYVDGVTLRQMVINGPRILPERSLEITAGVLAALDYAHRHGIVHRDIKPANVMINAHGDAKVMDFGIARAMSDAATAVTVTSAVMGTAQYLSPEQARGESVDARSDIYSTGCVLYELLTGRPPFNAESPVAIAYQHVNEPPQAPSSIDPSIPSTLDAIVLHSLEKQPSNRYQSAAEMRADVERAIAGMPIMANTVALTPAGYADTQAMPIINEVAEVSEGRKKRGIGKWIATTVAVALAVGAMFFLGNKIFGNNIPTVTIPNLSGKTVGEAETVLTDAGLVLGTQTPQNDNNTPKGEIITQDPASGETIAQGSKINITVSNGKLQTAVPDLIDLATQDDARAALIAVQLTLGKVTSKDSDKPEGSVIEQSVVPNTQADVGSAIDIVVSSGKIAIPNEVNKTQVQAMNDLVNLGFQVQVLQQEAVGQVPGTVLAQTPVGGTMALKGTTVTLVIAKAASVAPSTSPSTTTP